MRRHTLEILQAVAASRGGRCLSAVYISAREPVSWECESGHQWSAPFDRVRRGNWCPRCARWSIGELAEVAQARGGRLLSEEIQSSRDQLAWECERGHRWTAHANNVLNGTWCPACAGNARLTLGHMIALAAERGGECLSERYANARTKLRWRCASQHEWEAVPYAIKAGTWCPVCAGRTKGL